MAQTAFPSLAGRILARILFAVAALDGLLAGGWVLLRPNDFFLFLHRIPGEPMLVLLLGLLSLAHAGICIVIAWKPRVCGGLVVLPLTERSLRLGLWLWYLAASLPPVPPTGPVVVLATHEALWLPPFLCFLLVWSRRPREAIVPSGG